MTNRAYLGLSQGSEYPGEDDEPILEANYCIPLLWLALYSPEDIAYTTGEDGTQIPYLVTRVESAKRRFAEREGRLRDHFVNIDDHLAAWRIMLDMLETPFVKAEIAEIIWLSDNGEALLQDALAFFASASESGNTTSLLTITALDQIYDTARKTINREEDWSIYLILGGKFQAWLPWTDPNEEEIELAEPPTPPAHKKSWWRFWER